MEEGAFGLEAAGSYGRHRLVDKGIADIGVGAVANMGRDAGLARGRGQLYGSGVHEIGGAALE